MHDLDFDGRASKKEEYVMAAKNLDLEERVLLAEGTFLWSKWQKWFELVQTDFWAGKFEWLMFLEAVGIEPAPPCLLATFFTKIPAHPIFWKNC